MREEDRNDRWQPQVRMRWVMWMRCLEEVKTSSGKGKKKGTMKDGCDRKLFEREGQEKKGHAAKATGVVLTLED